MKHFNFKQMNKILFLALIVIYFCSCKTVKMNTSEITFQAYELPHDLAKISDEHLAPILPMLKDAKIIGMSEGTHGMIEPFYFRNALIKYLVKQKRISVVAIESGLIESRIAYDYVNGADISLDSAINNGLLCTFEKFRHNRELLEWLRVYNLDKTNSEKVHFYGFDIPGCAPNVVLENAMSGFDHVLLYLNKVDAEKFKTFSLKLSQFRSLLRIKDNVQDSLDHFLNIDSTGWMELEFIVNDLDRSLTNNSKEYKVKSSEEDFVWAQQALVGARQNVDFLRSYGNSNFEYNIRELEMFNNINWIIEREPNESVLLFSHLAHLAKEIHMDDPRSMPFPQTGEYLVEKFGDDYIVIGNFYMKLDWFDGDPIVLDQNTIDAQFQKFGIPNFYIKLDKSDSKWDQEWNFGKLSGTRKVLMFPNKSIDIVLYNEIQTWVDAEQNK